MSKQRLEGIELQINAIFTRLEAIKNSLPEESREKYLADMEQRRQTIRERYNVNVDQLDEWFQ